MAEIITFFGGLISAFIDGVFIGVIILIAIKAWDINEQRKKQK